MDKLKNKEPWVSVKITVTLKNKPKNYAGFTSKTFACAADEPAPLSILFLGAAVEIVKFCGDTTNITIEELNNQIKMAAARLLNFNFKIVVQDNTKSGNGAA
jgi:hypothetical protein